MKKLLIGLGVSIAVLTVAALLIVATSRQELQRKKIILDPGGKADYPSEWYDEARKRMRTPYETNKDK